MRYLLIASVLVLATPGTAVAASPTPGVSPSPSTAPVVTPLPGELRINEFLPNPIGTDTGNEWVELANVSDHDVSAGGVVVARASGSILATVPSGTTIKAGAVFLVSQLSGSIVNGGDTLVLRLGQTELDRITYDGNGAEGASWSRSSAAEGFWMNVPTPGLVNPSDEPAGDEDATGGGVGSSASTATTRASAASAKASPRATKTSAKKLSDAGLPGVPYLLGPGLAMLYWYSRRSFL